MRASLKLVSSVAPSEEQHLAERQGQLRPIFDVLPHNKHGNLDSAGVRYLLYRHFLHRSAWLMKGVASKDGTRNAPFPVDILRMSAEARGALSDHLDGRGLSLREVSVLASLLESQVYSDALHRLEIVWQAQGLSSSDIASRSQMVSVLDSLILTYVDKEAWDKLEEGKMELPELKEKLKNLPDHYATWDRTQKFLRELLERERSEVDEGTPLSFSLAEHIVLEIIEHFGLWQDKECRALKEKLLSLETTTPGRVDLVSFYDAALKDDKWFFLEDKPYLKLLGALDENSSSRPSVIVPNYINSASNYLGSSADFALVCQDECMDILSQIEHRIGSSSASVESIVAIVQEIRSPSGSERPAMTESLLEKLNQVASANGGSVQVHGRLFALWLHHVYPRDCSYPHEAGTTNQEDADEYEDRTGILAQLDEEEMRKAVKSGGKGIFGEQSVEESDEESDEEPSAQISIVVVASGDDASTTKLPWDTREELVSDASSESPTFNALLEGVHPAVPALAVAGAATLLVCTVVMGLVVGDMRPSGPFLDLDASS